MARIEAEISLDSYALRILQELQRDSRQTVAQLSASVGLSPTPFTGSSLSVKAVALSNLLSGP